MILTCNGTQLHKHDLAKLQGINTVNISFDGKDAKTFEALRCGARFQQVLDNIDHLRVELPDGRLQFAVCVCRLNLCQLADIYTIAREKGALFMTFNTVYGPEEDRVIQLLRLRESDRAELKRQFDEIDRRNSDGKLQIFDITEFDEFDDGAPLNYDTIYDQLQQMRTIEPYLDYDEQADISQADRQIHVEARSKDEKMSPRLPFCTAPWTSFDVLASGKVQPCCAGFGVIDDLTHKSVQEVWNGENYQQLRRAMFDWEMLPDFCRKCRVSMRYNGINDYISYLGKKGILASRLLIPPEFWPKGSVISDDTLWRKICMKQEENLDLSCEVAAVVGEKPAVSTWDAVAQEYTLTLDHNDRELAREILHLLEELGLNPGARLLELGSGSGHLSACLAQAGYQVSLLDFSQEALKKSKQVFEKYHLQGEFIHGDIFNLSELTGQYDLMWNSGVMEHFVEQDFLRILQSVRACHGGNRLLFLVPNPNSRAYLLMRYSLYSNGRWEYGNEYVRRDYESLCRQAGFAIDKISYCNSEMTKFHFASTFQDSKNVELYESMMDTGLFPKDECYLVAYSLKTENLDIEKGLAEKEFPMAGFGCYEEKMQLCAETFGAKRELTKAISSLHIAQNTLAAESAHAADLQAQLTREINHAADLQDQLTREINHAADLQDRLTQKTTCAADLEAQLTKEISHAADLQAELTQKTTCAADLEAQLTKEISHAADLQAELTQKTTCAADLQAQVDAAERKIGSALQQLYAMAESRLIKSVHFINRLKYQGFGSDTEERKKFRRWLCSRFRHAPDMDHRYHPIFTVINLLTSNVYDVQKENVGLLDGKYGQLAEHLRKQEVIFDSALAQPLSREAQNLQSVIADRKYKGILIYPHVVFWEPLQTPQQLLRAFAQDGWLCFFCEHSSIKDAYREVEPNLFITHEADLLQAVGQTPVTVLLTWMGSISFVNRISNKSVWYHILDHLQIFPYYDAFYQELHLQTLKTAKLVSYVAGPLRKWVGDRLDANYLPNGANPAEISNIHEEFIPSDMEPIVATGHKIVGYYGYLAEWMDYEMVRQMALARTDWEFVFIGKAIHDISLIENLPNVHLLGLKNYKELSDYAKFFDVATIPFLVDEKMDCVSPIKFYEYLALGKPVVSSSMKELQPFADQWDFISCANGLEEFLSSLELVMLPKNQLAAKENGPLIAEQNSWISRAQCIAPRLTSELMQCISQVYTKPDVIVLSIIDYSFRHQRPQHLAQRLAQKGHRVFYVNANFTNEYAQSLIEQNLWQVTLQGAQLAAIHLSDWEKEMPALQPQLDRMLHENAIRDAVVIVDYPNWIHTALYLREKYGIRMMTDYMDDFTGFLNPAEALVRKNCELLLHESDSVMASSQFLYDIASKYTRHVALNRNGTEFAYFHQAWQATPKPKARPVIGYYGAIAEWFNADIVCRCAQRFPQYDIVLVGNITDHRKELEQYSNIKLIGEVPYAKLLPWLASFDVCLIPFDASTDLIKATNPVKFYEYLSAGKKIVATEIPELEPYRDQFVYLENDAEDFCDAVERCLNGTDILAEAEECFAFAKENDWDARTEVFEQEALAVYPKISVIVLCYNQLDYTKKCVESVLHTTAYPNYELILVDNASTDATADYLKTLPEKYDNVKIVLNETNRGFAGGNNDGIAVADGAYLVLLNNDTLVTRGWLTNLLKHFRNDKSVGLVGPVTNSIGNEAKISISYTSISQMPLFAENYTFTHMGEEYPHHGILAMFCLMISRELYEKTGPLDENYGIGMFEDDDYSVASERLGYRNVLAEDVFIHHFGSASFKKLENAEYMRLHGQNKKYFEQKWHVNWEQPQKRPEIL